MARPGINWYYIILKVTTEKSEDYADEIKDKVNMATLKF